MGQETEKIMRCKDRDQHDAKRGRAGRLSMALAAVLVALGALGGVAPAQTLPDGRQWEQVSPAEKDGVFVEPLGEGANGLLGGLTQASLGGATVTYNADGPVGAHIEGNRAIEASQLIATRTANGWVSRDITTPHSHGEGFGSESAPEYRRFSPDLSLALVQPYITQGVGKTLQEPPLQPGLEREEATVYRRHNPVCERGPVGCYEPILNAQNVTGQTEGKPTPFGGAAEFLSASPRLQQVVVESVPNLAPPNDPRESPEEKLYEIDSARAAASEQVQLVSILPEEHKYGCATEAPPPICFPVTPLLGGSSESSEEKSARGAISEDGTRVFWSGIQTIETSTVAAEVRHLFVRDTRAHRTIRVDKAETGVKEPKTETALADIEPQMQLATSDGTRVFFTDTVPLTASSKLVYGKEGPTLADLYVCELKTLEEGCKLTDLTAGLGTAGADVLGEVIGASSDGTSVYVAANGAPEGGQSGNCQGPHPQPGQSEGGTCNLYVVKYEAEKWQTPHLITQLSGADTSDWDPRSQALAARVSPNGRYLAFTSERELTGFNNVDANPMANGARDREVYRYDSQAGAEALTCVSCNAAGRAPKGVFDPHATGLLVDPKGVIWQRHWLAGAIPPWTALSAKDGPYQSRYLLDDGSVFFESADPLSKEALEAAERREEAARAAHEPAPSGVMAVYENKPDGLDGCTDPKGCTGLLSGASDANESAFMDASDSGEGAFFLTSATLSPSDIDGSNDIYDAHVCSEAAPCFKPPPPPAPGCAGEQCHGAYSGFPTWAPGASATFSGSQEGPVPLPAKEVLPSQEHRLTRVQKLRRALHTCRAKYRHSHHRRAACERAAQKAYGPRHTAKKAGAR